MDNKPRYLLIMACSQRKRPDPGLLAAIERYDGSSFQVLRRFLREQPNVCKQLDIIILSDAYGLIAAEKPIDTTVTLSPMLLASQKICFAKPSHSKKVIGSWQVTMPLD